MKHICVHSCGLLPTEKKTPGHVIHVTKHSDVQSTRVILPFELEEVLEPDKNCIPSLQEMGLRKVGRLLYTWPGKYKNKLILTMLELASHLMDIP